MKICLAIIYVLLFFPSFLPAEPCWSELQEGREVIICRSGFSKEERDLNYLRSLAKEEHAWEMLKGSFFRIDLSVKNP